MKIIAVIVTHNRRELLERCLNYIENQTRIPDYILVINNSSTDGTLEMLINRQLEVITQENLGSSAGWYSGIEYALSKGFDAVWLMDDDGFPDAKALELLEQQLLPNRSCVSSVVIQENHPGAFVFPFPKLNAKNLPKLFSRNRKIASLFELKQKFPNGFYSFAHLFNGALIDCNAIRVIGNVNKDYFIYGDEVDYFFRLRTYGEVVSVLDAIHYHPDVSVRPYTMMKMYFYLKNTLILNQLYFDWVWIRHGMAILAIIIRTAKRNGLTDLAVFLGGSLFYRALLRGIRGKLGHDFNEA